MSNEKMLKLEEKGTKILPKGKYVIITVDGVNFNAVNEKRKLFRKRDVDKIAKKFSEAWEL